MIKNLVLIISVVVACSLTLKALNTEKIEHVYVLDSMKFLPTWRLNQEYAIECNQEHLVSLTESDVKALEVDQISRLISKAIPKCATEGFVGIPLKVGKTIFEAAAIPVRATIPYELAKAALSSKGSPESVRCSDYIEPIVLACPNLLKPYTKQIKQLDNSK